MDTQLQSHPAAVVHAAQQGHRLCPGEGVVVAGTQADRTGGGRAWGWGRVATFEAGGHNESLRVVGVALDEQVNIPLAVKQQVLSLVHIQTQSPRNLLTREKTKKQTHIISLVPWYTTRGH